MDTSTPAVLFTPAARPHTSFVRVSLRTQALSYAGRHLYFSMRVSKSPFSLSKSKPLVPSAGENWQEYGLIFPSKVGTPDDPSNLRKDFIKTLLRAGLPLMRFHDLRHTAASLMLNNGVPPIVVSRILGHAKPSITMDVYGHLYHEMQSEAARIMDELVTPILVDLEEQKSQGVILGENDISSSV